MRSRNHSAALFLAAHLRAFAAPVILTTRARVALGAVVVLGLLAAFGLAPFGLVDGLAPSGLALAALAFAVGDMEEITALMKKQGEAWEEFKKANDARLAEVEKKGHASADAVEKVSKIEADLQKVEREMRSAIERADQLEKKLNRPGAGGGNERTPEQVEYRAALDTYLRTGADNGLRGLERKAMSSQSDPDGGFLVDPDMDREIDRVASVVTGVAGVSRQVTVGSNAYKKMAKTRGVSGGWVGEAEDSSETNAPLYSELEIAIQKVYAEPWVPNDLLEDAGYDIEGDLADEAGITFNEIEGNGFINGSGVKAPYGLLSYPAIANASYAWGKIGYIATGNSGTFDGSNPADDVITLQHALKQQYRGGAVFVMADSTFAVMRQFKDGSGSFYLWNVDPAAGPSGRFLGAPVVIDDYMPAMGANSYSVAYGNFRRGYTIARRRGISVIRDNVTKKGVTKFNFTRRVGGGVTNFEAIKLLKFGTS